MCVAVRPVIISFLNCLSLARCAVYNRPVLRRAHFVFVPRESVRRRYHIFGDYILISVMRTESDFAHGVHIAW